ncbi:MAG: asparagine synthase (glutamine-hydrolyzing) [Chloroherpetonaceae bacterium]|nr:asparagine synthase (glutamine-hydrolyzing) [Chloroherpetonaceae bacterium]
MCGIAAIYSRSVQPLEERRCAIRQMTEAMKHRGPDGEGYFVDDYVALGHRRLAILELSELGAQPMMSRTPSSNQRYVITFNGEIYNYLELNARLAQLGIAIQSHSDTETILAMYEAFGEDCLQYLRGMFAFVIWDRVERKLFAARDRFGQKPLLYAKVGEQWVFASELKGILASGLVARKLCLQAVDELFETGSVMQPHTIVEGVFALMPAHALVLQDGKEKMWRYWAPNFQPTNSKAPAYNDAKAELRARFIETVRQHLISDVPLGVFLSGGVDSSLIVAIMRTLGQETKTYSIGFDVGGSAYNETSFAKQVAKRYGTIHTEIVLSEHDISKDLEHLVEGIDQPSHDGMNTYFVSKFARQYVTVALSGLGSDELFGGYTLFKFAQRLLAFQRITKHIPKIVQDAAVRLNEAVPAGIQENWTWRGVVGLLGAYRTASQIYAIRTITPKPLRQDLLQDHLPQHTTAASDKRCATLTESLGATDLIQTLSFLELSCYMLNTLLRDTDATSMAHSLEVRVPFLDHIFADYVTSLPASYKIDAATKNIGKKILIDAFSDLLPKEIVYRKKMGFVFPLAAFMRKGRFRELIQDTLSEQAVRRRGLLNPDAVAKLKREFFASDDISTQQYRLHTRLWIATLLELWLRRFQVSC